MAALFEHPTTLRYRRLQANYQDYWEPDSDAINAIDRQEMKLWFESRGDECLNCSGMNGSILMRGEPLIIKIHKTKTTP